MNTFRFTFRDGREQVISFDRSVPARQMAIVNGIDLDNVVKVEHFGPRGFYDVSYLWRDNNG